MQSVRVCDSTLTERYRSTIYMYWERLLQPFELIREYHEHIIGGLVLNHTSTFHVKTKLWLGGDLLETFCAKCLKCVRRPFTAGAEVQSTKNSPHKVGKAF